MAPYHVFLSHLRAAAYCLWIAQAHARTLRGRADQTVVNVRPLVMKNNNMSVWLSSLHHYYRIHSFITKQQRKTSWQKHTTTIASGACMRIQVKKDSTKRQRSILLLMTLLWKKATQCVCGSHAAARTKCCYVRLLRPHISSKYLTIVTGIVVVCHTHRYDDKSSPSRALWFDAICFRYLPRKSYEHFSSQYYRKRRQQSVGRGTATPAIRFTVVKGTLPSTFFAVVQNHASRFVRRFD